MVFTFAIIFKILPHLYSHPNACAFAHESHPMKTLKTNKI